MTWIRERKPTSGTGSVIHSAGSQSNKAKVDDTILKKSSGGVTQQQQLKRKNNESEGFNHKAKIPVRSRGVALKNWPNLVKPDDRLLLKARVSKHLDYKPVKAINQILSTEKKRMFKRTCFGYLLQLPEFHIQTQLIHNLLLRELKQPTRNEMWFDIADIQLRFSIAEFSLITGLKCHGSMAMSCEAARKKGSDGLYERYFRKSEILNKQTVSEVFTQNAEAASVEDAVKLVVLYLIECFVLSGQSTNAVNRETIDFIDYGDYNEHAWGKVAYAATIGSIKNRMKEGLERTRKGDTRDWNYRLYDFPYALQVWFYECCKGAKEYFSRYVFREGDHIPRMLSWRSIPFQGKRDWVTNMFLDDKETLQPSNLSPSPDERFLLDFDNIFVKSAENSKYDGSRSEEMDRTGCTCGAEINIQSSVKS